MSEYSAVIHEHAIGQIGANLYVSGILTRVLVVMFHGGIDCGGYTLICGYVGVQATLCLCQNYDGAE